MERQHAHKPVGGDSSPKPSAGKPYQSLASLSVPQGPRTNFISLTSRVVLFKFRSVFCWAA